MNEVKKSAALIVTMTSLSVATLAFASAGYEDNPGQSDQLSKVMERLSSQDALDRDEWRNSKMDEDKKQSALKMFREHNMQGQSGGMSSTKPYVDLNKEQLDGPSDRGGAAHSPLHAEPIVGNRLDK